ncbi:thiamine-phosphate kinase [Anaeroselena agilis]|uniref:Thiamine-monophosphate kinase n=1 Tax=Anaeroselena agilis TaxID=3063788 RepID=A0ABU3NT74_9FIRM|nr:thiamine-phosphate kinase [Selenomonadales bacterium 4137-cl]
MQLNEIGEFGLIDRIKEGALADPSDVVVGIGDDAAAYRPGPGLLQLITTDMLVESVHFLLDKTTPWQLGYKAIAVNLSDIAAMGGRPRQAVVSVGLPAHLSVEFVVELYDGMKEICREFAVNIIGGDTVSSPRGLVVNVAVTGEVAPARLLRRSGSRPGDLVVVTGTLGDSACGLDLLRLPGWDERAFAWPLVTAHLTPRPQVDTGLRLAPWGATSADDISDGLASEANEIAKAGGVGIRLYADRIPLSPELVEAAAIFGRQPLDYALFGGEDFELIFTIGPEHFDRITHRGGLTVIGEVTRREDGVVLVTGGAARPLEPRGYNHFR